MADRQTDRQTDGIAIAYMRYSIYAVARNNLKNIYLVTLAATVDDAATLQLSGYSRLLTFNNKKA